MKRLFSPILDLFRRADGRPAWGVVAAFVAIQVIVFSNAWRHDPRIGYDTDGHRAYTKVLATKFRLPTNEETHEFFSPPLPYLPAAIERWRIRADEHEGRQRVDEAVKVGQLVQAAASVPLTLAVMAIVRMIRPRRDAFAMGVALLCVGMMPVYYRSFAMMRGEPPMAMFGTVGLLLVLRAFALSPRPTIAAGAMAGVALGLACLSRQWVFFLLPVLGGVGLWRLVVDAPNRAATIRAGCATLIACAILAAPFYGHLHREYGSMRAFNRETKASGGEAKMHAEAAADDGEEFDPASLAPSTQRTTLGQALGNVFRRPIRDGLVDHPVLLAYADTWGDYWQYFLIYATNDRDRYVAGTGVERWSRERPKRSNFRQMPRYLGRVERVSLVPTAVLLTGLGAAIVAVRRWPRRPSDGRAIVLPTVGLCAVSAVAGYAWFVASYPSRSMDTVKATYLLQLFPLLAIATAALLARWRETRPRLAWGVVIALVVVLIHNAPTFFSRYPREIL